MMVVKGQTFKTFKEDENNDKRDDWPVEVGPLAALHWRAGLESRGRQGFQLEHQLTTNYVSRGWPSHALFSSFCCWCC